MRKLNRASFTLLLMSAFLTSRAPAQDAAAALARIDSVSNSAKDMTAREEMILIDRDGSQKTRTIRMYQKGSELRMVQFESPADVRGVGFLRRASDQLYLYLPAFRKVRRISSSATNENFMGTDFTYEDMSQNTYAADYEATALRSEGQEEGRYALDLIPKPGAGVSYGRLVLYADSSNDVLRRVEYYGRTDVVKKVLTIDDIQQIDGYWIGNRMSMQNQKTDHSTVLVLTEVEFDLGLKDEFFSQRMLKRPVR
ncbi:MAG: outer membrane lipoprotein-sorting protein [Rhodothermia bacterium]